jgi:hypothetical protein
VKGTGLKINKSNLTPIMALINWNSHNEMFCPQCTYYIIEIHSYKYNLWSERKSSQQQVVWEERLYVYYFVFQDDLGVDFRAVICNFVEQLERLGVRRPISTKQLPSVWI